MANKVLQRIFRALSAGEHAQFLDYIITLFFDWRAWAVGMGSWFLSYIGLPAIRNWSPLRITLTSIAIGGCCAFIYIAIAIFRESRRRKKRDVESLLKGGKLEKTETLPDLVPDIDANTAFKQILTNSEWQREQIRKGPNTTHPVGNWLEVRLDTEIHKALVNDKLKAWGEEILPNDTVAPERPIPADAWIKIELDFGKDAVPRTSAIWKVKRPYTGKTAWAGVKFSSEQFFSLFPPSSSSFDRIPCTALLKLAETNGWDFLSHNSLHLLDLQDAMRQGGIDDALTIWGREKKFSSDQLMQGEPLQKIEPAHWKNHYVHLFAARDGNNFDTYSWLQQDDIGRRGYIDLHVLRSQAVEWLRRDASSFKGRTKPK